MLFEDVFNIKVDATGCKTIVEGGAYVDNDIYDIWRYSNQKFQSGKIYGLISEFQQGCMYLSYLMGGKIDFGDLKIYYNEVEISQNDLKENSWNLEPCREDYKKVVVKKSIEKALKKSNLEEKFEDIAEKFILTEPRYDRKLFQLSGERWRASAALGYASGKKIFYAPYNTSKFYYQMCQSGLLKVLRELTQKGAVVLLPVGSDEFVKHIVDECIYINPEYDIISLKSQYKEFVGTNDWIKV